MTTPQITSPSPVSAVGNSTAAALDQNISLSWVCPICSFANAIKVSELDNNPPPCMTCGVRPAAAVLATAKIEYLDKQSRSIPPVQQAGVVEIDTGFPCPRCTFINHPSLRQCEICGAELVSQNLPPRLLEQSALKDDAGYSPSPTPKLADEEITYVKLSFRAGGEKVFLNKLKTIIQGRQWDSASIPSSTNKHHHRHHEQHFPRLGIHGLANMSAKERHQTTELMGSLTDLNSLMNKAQEMVALAESFAVRLASAPGVSIEAREALLQSSEALSLSSPIVMREVAGSQDELFYNELARQLAEFLDNGVLVREGGILTLFDLYALYNRARGISLISPKDFYKACSKFEALKLPFRMRKFQSGVIVIQEAYYKEDTVKGMVIDYIKQLCTEQGKQVGITPQQVNQHFGWSVMVAQEELENAENSGQLCRDSSMEGTRFYLNFIVSAHTSDGIHG